MERNDVASNAGDRLEVAPGHDHPLVQRVLNAAYTLDAGHQQTAEDALHSILDDPNADRASAQRVARLFAASLLGRLTGDRSGSGNLYLERPHPHDMLAAFQLLLATTPFIRYGYESANLAILGGLGAASKIHIVDIGIGSGTQWLGFLELVAKRVPQLRQLRLTGIDIPTPGDDPAERLRVAGMVLYERSLDLGIPFHFDPIAAPVEDVDFAAIAQHEDEVLAVNAAFALHHIATGDGVEQVERSRDAVLRRLHALQPRILTLVEPEADHSEALFVPRIREALTHYLTVFDALETLIGPGRATIERRFFGREILNIVAGEGAQRVERHERHESWQRRLERLGFAPVELGHLAHFITDNLDLAPPFDLLLDRGVMSLAWKGIPLVAASAWKPGA